MGSARRRSLKWWLGRALLASLALGGLVLLSLFALRYIDPVTTSVQTQRRVESWFAKGKYQKRYQFVPMSRMSVHVPHAVVAAEDSNFYKHNGFDWEQIQDAIDDAEDGRRFRGASTLTQQLVKNLYFTLRFGAIRKPLEMLFTPAAERILGKKRILELYLNTAEWGPGVFGIEAAAQYHYHTTAANLTRDQAARLAAILPSPRRRRPAQMNRYSAIIQGRMNVLGW